jgi:adenylate cyclase
VNAADGGTFRDRFCAWLTGDGTSLRTLPALIDGYCRFLTGEGLAIHRCNLATDTIHPQMTGVRHVWFAEAVDPGPIDPAVLVARRQYPMGEALIDEIFFNAESQQSAQYKASPFYQVEQVGELYAAVLSPGEKQPYPVFDDLVRQGCTAYYGLRLNSFAGMLQKISLATRRPGSFTAEQVSDVRLSLELLTLHINTLIENSIRETLARVYLGRDPGKRVSSGMIAVGNVVTLEGAIWFSDLRSFTATSERMSPEQLIETLNRYFAVLVPAIHANGGEVLKYIGDAVLAVFTSARTGGPGESCRAALAAAGEVERALARINESGSDDGAEPIAHGIGLHYGEARYGNIGSSERLDFTLIGREVNVASRIAGLNKQLGRTLLCSRTFADLAGLEATSLGGFALQGVEGEIEIACPAHLVAQPG